MRAAAMAIALGAMAAAGCSSRLPANVDSSASASASGVPAGMTAARAAGTTTAKPSATTKDGDDGVGDGETASALAAPRGWMAWGLAPPGCTVWIPESRGELARLGELTWKACPFQSVGCAALGATWAARTGWGFGGRLGAVAAGGATYLTLTRQIEPEIWETLILAGATALRPVAAWRQRLPEAGCVLGSVSLTVDGERVTAALPIVRAEAENAPLVVMGAPESLSQQPEPMLTSLPSLDGSGTPQDEPRDGTRRVESFGAPGAEVMASGVALRRGELLAVWEHEGRFALRDLASGRTARPMPQTSATSASPPGDAPAFRALLEPTPAAGAVLFGAWTGDRNSVWAADRHGRTAPLLSDPRASIDRFATDGERAVWLRSTGFRDLNTFAHVELWTGRVAAGAAGASAGAELLEPRRVRALPGGPLPLVSLGEGWAALWNGEDDVVLIRLSDGELRRLPAVPKLSWDGGSGGLAIAGGAVWARASLRGQAGNDSRLVARFALEALPKGFLR